MPKGKIRQTKVSAAPVESESEDSSTYSSSDGESDNGDTESSLKKALQLITIEQNDDDGFSFKLNEQALDDVLSTTQDRPLVVINVVGEPKCGKSFLLNFIMRSLEALESESLDWMDWDKSTKPLTGFSWKHGMTPETKGVWVWGRAFLIDGDEGELAVLLLDTQGLDEENMSPEEIASLLQLTMLVSSITIFNVSGDLPLDILKTLSTHLKFGQLAIENDEDDDEPPFQTISFLVRDWNNPGEYPFGKKGGRAVLDEKVLRRTDLKGKAAAQHKKLREAFKKSYKRTECWLMPNIGDKALQGTSKGAIADFSPEFAKNLEAYINDLVSSENLFIKKILDAEVTKIELKNFLIAYLGFFNSDEEAEPEALWELTARTSHESIITKAMQKYDDHIISKRRGNRDYLSEEELEAFHTQAKKKALVLFRQSKKLEDYKKEYSNKLDQELKKAFESMKAENESGRSTFVAECVRQASDTYRTELGDRLRLSENCPPTKLVFHEEEFIQQVADEGKRSVSEKFKSNFVTEEEENVAVLVQTLHSVLSSITDTFLEANRRNRVTVEGILVSTIENLLQEYQSSLKSFLARNECPESSILDHFHAIYKKDLIDKFAKMDKPGPIEFQQEFGARLRRIIDETYESMSKMIGSKIEENHLRGTQLMKEEQQAYFNTLKKNADDLGSEEGLRAFHMQKMPTIMTEFEQKNPFPEGSSQRQSLNLKLKTELETSFERVLQEEIVLKKRIEGLYKNAVDNSFKLYSDGMANVRGPTVYVNEANLNEEHVKLQSEATAYFENMTNSSRKPDNAEEHKGNLNQKIANAYEVHKRDNDLAQTLAHSETKNLLNECVKLYESLMKEPSENCFGVEELEVEHKKIVDTVVQIFQDKSKVKCEIFLEEYYRKLRQEMEETYEEVRGFYEMRKNSEEATLRNALEPARRYYHDQMETHFRNNQFMRPQALQTLHDQVSQAAIDKANSETALKDTHIAELRQMLERSFKRWLDKNDMNLNSDVDSEPAIGIDLGTTYCCVAVYYRGQIKIIPNSLGGTTTPSYVSFEEDGSQKVGQPAKDNAYKNPENTVFDAKRILGRSMNNAELQNDMEFWPFSVVQGEDSPAIRIRGTNHYPEEIAAILLRTFKEDAERFLNRTIRKAVITVPAYFTDGQRQATVDAGEIVFDEVLTILNEPTAAAIAYKLERFDDDARKVLIFDLGGGTFDVAVLETVGKKIEVLGVDGDTHLGGEDFDKNMMKFCAEEFKKSDGIDLFADKDSPVKQTRDGARQRLRRLQTHCEKCKKELAAALSSDISVDTLVDGKDFHISISRTKFEELNADLFQKTIDIVDKALKDAKVRKEDIDDIVLVGGSTRIPRVQRMLREYFNNNKALTSNIHPDEAVAYGAAIQAAMLNGAEEKKAFNFTTIQDVTPMPLGIEAIVDGVVGQFSMIIPKNTKIPIKEKEWYATSGNNQTSTKIKIYQGESAVASENTLLGEFIMDGIPPGPAGRERVDVLMEVNAMGILHVDAVCKSTRGKKSLTVTENKGRLSRATKTRLLQEASATNATPVPP